MKYNQLMEGVIKVPPSVISTLNKYVASTICTMLYKNMEVVQKIAQREPQKAQEQSELIQKIIGYLKQNYNAVIMNDSTYKNILQSSVNVPVNFNSFFNEINIKLSDEIKQKIQQTSLLLSVRNHISDGSGGALNSDQDLTTFLIEVKCDINIAPLDPNVFSRVKDVMSSVYHEAQHYIQKNVLERINSNQKQLQSTSNLDQNSTREDYASYLSSGIEYSPWMGDLMNAVITELEIMKVNGTLPADGLNKIFMKLIIKISSDDKKSFGKFLYEVYKKNQQQYKDTLKKIFKMVQPVYDSIKETDIMQVLGDLKEEDFPVDFDVTGTLFNDLKPAVEKAGGKFTAFGRNIKNISKFVLTYSNYEVTIKPYQSGKTYMVTMESTDGNIDAYSRELSQSDTLQLCSVLKKYGDDEEMTYNTIQQTKADGKFSSEAVESVFKTVSTLNEELNGEKSQYTSSEIVIGSVTYEVKPEDKSYHLSSPELILMDAYLKNTVSVSMFLQEIVRTISRSSAQEVQTVLENCFNEYDAIKALRNI